MKRLILWDVDGTLVRVGGGAAREPFQKAVATVLGLELEEALHEQVQMSGKTDPEIARELLVLAKVADHRIDGHLPAVLQRLEAELAAVADQIRVQGRVLPGAAELLERLAGVPGVVQSVLTGNLEANAAVKLAAFGLDRWLDLAIGAYGSDDADRERLVPIARRKAAKRHGLDVEPGDVWVIGDTPRDLRCARAGGARCLLVASGRFTPEELDGLGADAVMADLVDGDAVMELLGP